MCLKEEKKSLYRLSCSSNHSIEAFKSVWNCSDATELLRSVLSFRLLHDSKEGKYLNMKQIRLKRFHSLEKTLCAVKAGQHTDNAMKIIALTPQRLARRSKRCFRSRGGKRLLRAIERNLALRGKQARERWSRERKENTLGSVYKCNWSSLCFWEILLSSAFGFRKCCFVARRGNGFQI